MPGAKDILKNFESTITAIHDLERGTPFRLMDEVTVARGDPSERQRVSDHMATLTEEQERLALELVSPEISVEKALAERSQ